MTKVVKMQGRLCESQVASTTDHDSYVSVPIKLGPYLLGSDMAFSTGHPLCSVNRCLSRLYNLPPLQVHLIICRFHENAELTINVSSSY